MSAARGRCGGWNRRTSLRIEPLASWDRFYGRPSSRTRFPLFIPEGASAVLETLSSSFASRVAVSAARSSDARMCAKSVRFREGKAASRSAFSGCGFPRPSCSGSCRGLCGVLTRVSTAFSTACRHGRALPESRLRMQSDRFVSSRPSQPVEEKRSNPIRSHGTPRRGFLASVGRKQALPETGVNTVLIKQSVPIGPPATSRGKLADIAAPGGGRSRTNPLRHPQRAVSLLLFASASLCSPPHLSFTSLHSHHSHTRQTGVPCAAVCV